MIKADKEGNENEADEDKENSKVTFYLISEIEELHRRAHESVGYRTAYAAMTEEERSGIYTRMQINTLYALSD